MMSKISESKLQQEIVLWFRNNYCLKFHNPRLMIYSVPNERASKVERMRMKNIGALSGVADLTVVLPNKIIFVELKVGYNKQSDTQKEFENRVISLGFEYHLVRSLEDFKKIIQKNLFIKII